MNCPGCGRPVAVERPACLYCGAALSAEEVAAAGRARAAALLPPPPPERRLLVVRLHAAEARALQGALGLSAYEAAQLARRGGYHLHRALPPGEAEAERSRLGAAGLSVLDLDEAAVRAAAEPRPAAGGAFVDGALELRLFGGRARIAVPDLLLVVRGPITRERPASDRHLKRNRTATLEQGYRFHLHRAGDRQPVEIDPGAFEFDRPRSAGGSLLEIAGWIGQLAGGAPVDDAFRRMPPALAPALAAAGPGVAGADGALRRAAGREEEVAVLDNLAQFRFYSAWRGAAERQDRR